MSMKYDGNSENNSRKKKASVKKASSAADNAGLTLHQERELRRRRRRRRIIAMIIAECFTLAAIFGYGYFLRQWNQIQRPSFDEVKIKNNDLDLDTIEKMRGYWTIAIFGVDSRDNALIKDTHSDVNIICNINLDTGEIKLVSVFRDSYLNINNSGSYNKINLAYFQGGPEQAVAALNRNLDLDITDYMTFNWKAVADAINILGGVDVEISNAEFYYINSFITETVEVTGVGSHHLKSAGMNHLDGVQAVAYGRLRLMDTDFARTERQRKIISLAFDKARNSDFDTLNRVLGTVFPQVATSINVNDIFKGLKIINRYHLGETMGFPQARGDANMGRKGACVIPQTLETNVAKLHEFLFGVSDYTPSATVKKISSQIAADTGMYREGSYVKDVGTEGGVIQSAKAEKTSKAAAEAEAARSSANDDDNDDSPKSTKSRDEEKYASIYVLDKDGNRVKKTVVMETDSDGDYIEPETNGNGLAIGWSIDSDGDLVRRETKAGGLSAGTSASHEDEETEEEESGSLEETSPVEAPFLRPTNAETDGEESLSASEERDGRTNGVVDGPGMDNEDETSGAGPGVAFSSSSSSSSEEGETLKSLSPTASSGTNSTTASNHMHNPTSSSGSGGTSNSDNTRNSSSSSSSGGTASQTSSGSGGTTSPTSSSGSEGAADPTSSLRESGASSSPTTAAAPTAAEPENSVSKPTASSDSSGNTSSSPTAASSSGEGSLVEPAPVSSGAQVSGSPALETVSSPGQ